MGECSSGATRCVKVLIYLAVVVSSSCMLYGFVQSWRSLKKCPLGGSTCILFGDFSALGNDSCAPDNMKNFSTTVGGNDLFCQYCMVSAAGQLVVAVLACIIVLHRLRRFKPGRSAISPLELFVICLAFAVAFGTALSVAMGFKLFCERTSEHWNDVGSIYRHLNVTKPGHCRDTRLTMDGKTADTHFYDDIHLAHVTAWIAAGAWFLHLIMSIFGVCSYRKRGATPLNIKREEKRKKEKENEKELREKKAWKKKEKKQKKKEEEKEKKQKKKEEEKEKKKMEKEEKKKARAWKKENSAVQLV